MPTAPTAEQPWSAEPRMSRLETMFWRGETDPRIRVTTMAVEVLDRVPAWDRLMRRHERVTRLAPRLRQRAVEPLLRLGRPHWRDDPLFDLGYHLRRVRLPAPGTLRHLLDFARTAFLTPLDRTRPLWEATLVEGLDGEGAGYVLKLHHSLCDGIGGAQLLALLHEADTPEGSVRLARPPARAATAPPTGTTRRTGNPVPAGFRFARSVLKATVLPAAPPSPLLGERSSARFFGAMTLPTARLRAAGRAAGGSLNDSYLALLLGAFDRYHAHFGVELAELPVLVPISTRTAASASGGNQFASHRLAGAMSGVGFDQRVRLVHAAVAAARAGAPLKALGVLVRCATPMPAPVIAFAEKLLFQGNDLIASNFPGLAERVRLAGARVEAVYPYASVVFGAMNAVLVSYADNCHLGVNLDPAAVSRPRLFLDCLHREWDEVAGRAGPSRGAGPRA